MWVQDKRGPVAYTVRVRDGEFDVVNGGTGTDTATIDRGLDSVRNVENIE
jgi:hypothetical protein